MPCGLIKPSLNAINKNINKHNESAILSVNEVMVRFVVPESRIRKINPLNKEQAIIIIVKMMMILVIICYTPDTVN